MDQMSPLLQAEVAYLVYRHYLIQVWYLKGCSDEFVAQISRCMVAHLYVPLESISLKQPRLCIVSRGLVFRGGHILHKGSIFGEDLILESPLLRRQPETSTLAYTELLTVEEKAFKELTSAHFGARALSRMRRP